MLHPTTHSWRYAQPTGMGWDLNAYRDSQRIAQGYGLGDATYQMINGMAATGASTTVSILAYLGTFGASSGPIGAAIVGIIAIASMLANQFQGCGQTCIQASNIANQCEPILLKNLNTYLASPVHYKSLQAAALNNFDFTWNSLMQACGNPQLATAGQNCVSDRQRGACKWKASPGGWSNGQYTPAGAAGSGDSCWNWWVGYRDPIANDPTVVPDPVPGSVTDPTTGITTTTNSDGSVSVSNSVTAGGGAGAVAGIPVPLILGGAAVLMLMMMGGKN